MKTAYAKKFSVIIVLFIILAMPLTAFAAGQLTGGLEKFQLESGYRIADEYSVSFTVGRVINGFLGLLGTIFLVLLVYAGYQWMTAQGEEEQVTKAKDLIRNAIIGLLVVLGAGGISFFVFDQLAKNI